MMTLTCCQDHILTENIWFAWSETSYGEDKCRCHLCGTGQTTRDLYWHKLQINPSISVQHATDDVRKCFPRVASVKKLNTNW